MGLVKASTANCPPAAVPAISLATPASPQSKEEPPTTPQSSPWRENPAFLPPGGAKPASADAGAPAQRATLNQPRSTVSADLSERLASMSVVGSGLHRVRDNAGGATDSSASGQADEGMRQAGAGAASVTGRASALGRLKDRQQQVARKTGEDDSSGKGPTPAKFYLQVPGKS